MRPHFSIPPFSPFLRNLGGLEKVGPEGYQKMRSFVFFSPVNQTVEILSLPSSSCHSKHIMRGREEKVLGIRQSNQVQRQYFFLYFLFSKEVLHQHYLGITYFHHAQKLSRARFDYLINFLFLIYRSQSGKIFHIALHDTW